MHLQIPKLAPGMCIAKRYKVLRELGHGMSGSVYAVVDTMLGNLTVAMKVLSPDLRQEKLLAAQFHKELRACSRIDHHNVVRFYDLIDSDGLLAYTMEFVEGESLQQQIDRHPPFSGAHIVSTLKQICSGLSKIHEAGVIHRDLKPANIMVAKSGLVKISDLGLAKLGGTPQKGSTPAGGASQQKIVLDVSQHSVQGVFVGTPEYIAPESIEHNRYDSRCDIYALGVIAYEMITGKMPYEYFNLFELFTKKVEGDPKAPHLENQQCLEDLGLIVMKAMSRNPKERYQHAVEVHKQLSWFETTYITQHAFSVAIPAPEPAKKRTWRSAVGHVGRYFLDVYDGGLFSSKKDLGKTVMHGQAGGAFSGMLQRVLNPREVTPLKLGVVILLIASVLILGAPYISRLRPHIQVVPGQPRGPRVYAPDTKTSSSPILRSMDDAKRVSGRK